MIVPETWPNLTAFVLWYKENNFPIRVPHNVRIYPTDTSYSACIFRQDVYQVEIYLGKPSMTSSKHSHPFEQYIIYLGGQIIGTKGSVENINKKTKPVPRILGDLPENCPTTNNAHPLSGKIPHYSLIDAVTPSMWHQISAGPQGFIFLNLQKWPNKEMMTSAVVEYSGDPLGPEHKTLIQNYKTVL